MRCGRLHAATEPGAHLERGLDAVVNEVGRVGPGQAQVVPERGQLTVASRADVLDRGHRAIGKYDFCIGAEAFSHRRPGRQDDQIGRLQAGGEFVEVGEPGGQAGDVALVFVAFLQDLEGVLHGVAQADEVGAAAAALLGDLEHPHLGGRQHFLAVAALGLEAVVDDFGAGFDQLPQHGLLAHDFGVGADVGGRGRGAGQFDQVTGAADLFAERIGLEPLAQGDRVEGFVLFAQLADGAVDEPVVTPVEVVFGEEVADAVERIGGQHEPAQHGLFGLDRLGRQAKGVDLGVGAEGFGTCGHDRLVLGYDVAGPLGPGRPS